MHSPNGWTDFDERYIIRSGLTRATRQFYYNRHQLRTLTLRRTNVGYAARSSELWPQISRKGYKIESSSQQKANIKLHVVCRNTLSILTYGVSREVKGLRNLRSWITRKRCEIESACQVVNRRLIGIDMSRIAWHNRFDIWWPWQVRSRSFAEKHGFCVRWRYSYYRTHIATRMMRIGWCNQFEFWWP